VAHQSLRQLIPAWACPGPIDNFGPPGAQSESCLGGTLPGVGPCSNNHAAYSPRMGKTDTAAGENPYLAHLADGGRSSAPASSGSAPFDGWIANKVTGKMVENAMVSAIPSLTCSLFVLHAGFGAKSSRG